MFAKKAAEMTFIRKTRAFNVDEIEPFSTPDKSQTEPRILRKQISSQFHQHFKNSICIDILSPKLTNTNCKHRKDASKHLLNKKAAHKMLIKLTPVVNFINIL
jgi:hypothetical protein